MKGDRSRSIASDRQLASGILASLSSRAGGGTRILDAILVSAGISCAAGSMAFAVYMLSQDIHRPRVRDMQYLALFAQPSRSNVRPTSVARSGALSGSVDMTPTGSIPSVAAPPEKQKQVPRIVGGQAGVVYVTDGTVIRALRPGDLVAGLGTVGFVAKREGRWEVLGRDRTVLLQQGESLDVNGLPAERFSRPFIFGAAKR